MPNYFCVGGLEGQCCRKVAPSVGQSNSNLFIRPSSDPVSAVTAMLSPCSPCYLIKVNFSVCQDTHQLNSGHMGRVAGDQLSCCVESIETHLCETLQCLEASAREAEIELLKQHLREQATTVGLTSQHALTTSHNQDPYLGNQQILAKHRQLSGIVEVQLARSWPELTTMVEWNLAISATSTWMHSELYIISRSIR